MNITAKDIGKFYRQITNHPGFENTDFLDRCIVAAIKKAELSHLMSGTVYEIGNKRLLSAWNHIWTITQDKQKSSILNATLSATKVFKLYIGIDRINNPFKQIAAVDISSIKKVGQSEIIGSADILKVDIKKRERNLAIVDLSHRYPNRKVALNCPELLTNVYCCYSGHDEIIEYNLLDINHNASKITVRTLYFYPEDMNSIYNMIKTAEIGIRLGVRLEGVIKCTN